MGSPVAEMDAWRNLRVVETIYEEDSGDSSSSSSTTPSLSSPPHVSSPSTTSLRSRVKVWSFNNGVETNVIVHVQGSNFHLHKDPLVRFSRYLKHQLTESSEVTLSPSFKITSDTFTLVVDYCYGGNLFITPFNLASLLLAAELLEMTEDQDNVESLRRKTEAYFHRTVAVDRDYATVVLNSCMELLPDVETKAGLVSRCIEALSLNRDVVVDVLSWFDGVQKLSGEEFRLVVGGFHQNLTGSHDFLYRIIDFYFKEEDGKMTEEEGIKICNYIDCSNLSSRILMHAVQNPRMPLRFVVQAMFIEQLNTRRTVFSATQTFKNHHKQPGAPTSITLGTILQRDAALRQVAHLRATMDYTSTRIESLEQELTGMKKILNRSDIMEPVKSESFRFSSERQVERGQKGSVSSGNFRVVQTENWSDDSVDHGSPMRFGKRVINGLKSAFRISSFRRSRDEIKKDN